MRRANSLNVCRALLVFANRDFDMFSAENFSSYHRGDTDEAQRFPGSEEGANSTLDFGKHGEVRAFESVIGQVFRSAESSRQNQGIEIERADLFEIFDISSRNTRGLDQNVPGFARHFFAGRMVDNMVLVDVGRKTDGLGARNVYGKKGEDSFMDFRAIHNATAGKKNPDFFHDWSQLKMIVNTDYRKAEERYHDVIKKRQKCEIDSGRGWKPEFKTMVMEKIDPQRYDRIVFFTGAGMSAESGVPTYRGKGGIWGSYSIEEYACQQAFDRNPEKVLRFHEKRRRSVLECEPHEGHRLIAALPNASIVTQNIDGMHQRAGSRDVTELHGSLWRLRCQHCGARKEDGGESYETLRCSCGNWLRPDIIWFGDMLDAKVMNRAAESIASCDLFISIGTSGTVWPAAGYPDLARQSGAYCVEINPEPSGATVYDRIIEGSAGEVLPELFGVTRRS